MICSTVQSHFKTSQRQLGCWLVVFQRWSMLSSGQCDIDCICYWTTPLSHVHSFCPLSWFLLVQPGRHLNPVLVRDCRHFFQSGSFFFGFRGEVVPETSLWHIVSHCTHSSSLFFLLLVWYIQMLLFNLPERCFIVEVHSFLSLTYQPSLNQ